MIGKDVKQLKASAIVFAAVAVLLTGAVVQAQVIVDGNGFEAPDFSTGQLEGQNNWLRMSGAALGAANVQTATVYSGDQAVQVDRAANSDDRWADPVVGWPSLPIVLIDWDMRVEETLGGAAYGPFFGVEAYADAGGLSLLGSLGVDATTSDVLYQAQGTGFLTETGATVTFGEWNHYQIVLDYAADQYTVKLNGTPLATDGFVDAISGDVFSDADISAIAAAGDPVSQALTGTAYYDNFFVQQVPEPGSFLLALGATFAAGLAGYRKLRA